VCDHDVYQTWGDGYVNREKLEGKVSLKDTAWAEDMKVFDEARKSIDTERIQREVAAQLRKDST